MLATKQEHGNSSALPLPGDAPSVPISSSLPPPLQHMPPLIRNRIPSPSSPTWSTSPAAATPQPFSHVRPLPSIELQTVEVRDQLLTALVCAGVGCLMWVRMAIRQCRPTPTPSRGCVRRGQARLARGAKDLSLLLTALVCAGPGDHLAWSRRAVRQHRRQWRFRSTCTK
jgi:hypothetical protein